MNKNSINKDSLFAIAKSDLLRYTGTSHIGVWKKIKKCCINGGLLYILAFRLIQKALQPKIPFFSLFLKLIHKFLSVLFGVEISRKANIGKGFRIWHCGAIFVGPVDIGKYCSVSSQVVIGLGGRGDKYGHPKIGNNVDISSGAKLYGRIRIGNNVSIGMNSVVSKDIPDNAIVVGNPGRIVRYKKDSQLPSAEADR